jgi:hypothetical protein
MEPSVIYDFDPRNLPPEVLAAIGLAVAASAQTESIIEDAIGGCLGLDHEYTMAVTTHMAAPLRDSVLRSAAEIRIDNLDDLDELDRLLDNVKTAFEKRNAIVHHSWCRHPDTGEVFTVKETARVRVEAELIPIAVDKIKRDAAFIYRVGMELNDFLVARNLLPQLAAESRARSHKSKAARTARRKKLSPK